MQNTARTIWPRKDLWMYRDWVEDTYLPRTPLVRRLRLGGHLGEAIGGEARNCRTRDRWKTGTRRPGKKKEWTKNRVIEKKAQLGVALADQPAPPPLARPGGGRWEPEPLDPIKIPLALVCPHKCRRQNADTTSEHLNIPRRSTGVGRCGSGTV